jgi:Spy/CpxP family protein refolding chaperone
MIRVRLAALTLGALALVVFVGTSAGADKAKKQKGKLGNAAQQLTRLLPDGAEDKLKLNDEQKKQVARIADDYKTQSQQAGEKLKDALAKNQEAIKKARQDKDKAALKDAASKLRDPAMEAKKLRDESREKVKAVLNDEQKKTFEEVLKEEPAIGGKVGKLLERKKKKNKPE